MSDPEAYSIPNQAAPSGVGGWFLFFVLTMVLFGPATYIVLFLRSYHHTIEVEARLNNPYLHYLFYTVEQLAGFALYGYGIFAGVQLWKIRPAALMHAKRFLLLLVLYHLAAFAVSLNFAWVLDPPGTVSRYLHRAAIRELRNFVYPGVWYSYLLRSKRVRNTFPSGTKPPPTLG